MTPVVRNDDMTLIAHDDLWPRDLVHRYRIYAITPGAPGGMEVLAATPTAGGIGIALVELHEEQKQIGRRLADLGVIGVLDTCPGGEPAPAGDWVVHPFPRGAR